MAKKQAYRYRVTGVMKFMVDDRVDYSEDNIKRCVEEDPGSDINFAQENGNLEILDLKIERLEPRDYNEYYNTTED